MPPQPIEGLTTLLPAPFHVQATQTQLSLAHAHGRETSLTRACGRETDCRLWKLSRSTQRNATLLGHTQGPHSRRLQAWMCTFLVCGPHPTHAAAGRRGQLGGGGGCGRACRGYCGCRSAAACAKPPNLGGTGMWGVQYPQTFAFANLHLGIPTREEGTISLALYVL